MATVLKTVGLEIVPWVRIPHSPPYYARLVKWMITLCYERRGRGSIPLLGTMEDGQDGNAAVC